MPARGCQGKCPHEAGRNYESNGLGGVGGDGGSLRRVKHGLPPRTVAEAGRSEGEGEALAHATEVVEEMQSWRLLGLGMHRKERVKAAGGQGR